MAQFERASRLSAQNAWLTDEVWDNPWSNHSKALVYVAPVLAEVHVVGVCYLEYDVEGQVEQIMSVSQRKATDLSQLNGRVDKEELPLKSGRAGSYPIA